MWVNIPYIRFTYPHPVTVTLMKVLLGIPYEENVILVTVTRWGLYSTGRFNRQSMAKICSPLVFVGCEVL